MSLFQLFPSCSNLLEASLGARLDRRFEMECTRSGIALNSQAAERIGMRMLADAISGLPSAETSILTWLSLVDEPGIDFERTPLRQPEL